MLELALLVDVSRGSLTVDRCSDKNRVRAVLATSAGLLAGHPALCEAFKLLLRPILPQLIILQGLTRLSSLVSDSNSFPFAFGLNVDS